MKKLFILLITLSFTNNLLAQETIRFFNLGNIPESIGVHRVDQENQIIISYCDRQNDCIEKVFDIDQFEAQRKAPTSKLLGFSKKLGTLSALGFLTSLSLIFYSSTGDSPNIASTGVLLLLLSSAGAVCTPLSALITSVSAGRGKTQEFRLNSLLEKIEQDLLSCSNSNNFIDEENFERIKSNIQRLYNQYESVVR